MKRNIIYLVGALLSSAILTLSCSDDDTPTYSDISVDKTDLFIKIENPTTEVNIISGNGNYKVTVADDNIASAQIDGNKIIVTGLKNGTTTATVIDWTKHSSVINIKVKEDFELKTDKEEVTLFLDEEKLSTTLVNIVSGNGDYKVESSNEEVATAEMNDKGQILITAVSSDFCDVILTDADGNKETVKVGVCAEHLVIEDIMGKACIKDQTMDITITTGNGEYSVVSENPEIATAEMVDGVIRVTGVAKGETNITVTDRMKQTATVNVKVSNGFVLETTQIDILWIGEEQRITIVDGGGNYTITSSSSITCTLSEDKSELIINGKEKQMALNQSISITDNVFNKTIEIKVNRVEYHFEEYINARWYVQGSFQMGIEMSTISTNGEREHIKVGSSTFGWGSSKKPANGYHISFEGGRGVGKKTNPSQLVKINNVAGESNICPITDLEIVKREYTNDSDEANGKGKFWIRFKEEGREEYSYIITWF